MEIEEKEPKSKEGKHVEFESKLEYSPDSDLHFEPHTVISPDSKIVESPIALEESVEKNSGKDQLNLKKKDSHTNIEDSSDKVIPEDVSLASQFLLPNIDDSSSDEETEITELKTEAETNVTNNEEEMPSINSEASSLVNANEFLEFMDTIEMDEAEKTKQSEITKITEQTCISEVENPTEQTNVDDKSESQFNSFMSYHDVESSSMDPSTGEMELSKSPEKESTEENDSGTNCQEDNSSHDTDIIAYSANESSSSSVEISSSTNPVTEIEEVAEVRNSESAIEVEVMEPRRSGRNRKQTQLFGNPLLVTSLNSQVCTLATSTLVRNYGDSTREI